MSRVDAPREDWVLVAEIPALVSQEQFDQVQVRLVSNRRFAQRNNKVHPYLRHGLVSCGLCGLSCLARSTIHPHRWHEAVAELLALQADYAAWADALPDGLGPEEAMGRPAKVGIIVGGCNRWMFPDDPS